MDKNEFSQRQGLRARQFKLERDGIAVTEKSLLSSRRYHVPYECVSPKSEEITHSSGRMMSAAIFFTLLTAICVVLATFSSKASDGWFAAAFWAVPSVLCWGTFLYGRTSFRIYAQNNGALVLYANIPSEAEVTRFVRQVFESRNKFLRAKYGKLSLDQPLAERLAFLNLLRDQEAITEEEYSRLRGLQSDGPASHQGSIGFAH